MKTKDICITGLGIALFVVVTMMLQVPIFQNYYLCLGYIVMSLYLYHFGTLKGTLVGVIGTILYCVLTGGLRGMPGWAIGNIAIGIILGCAFNVSKEAHYMLVSNVTLKKTIFEVFLIIVSVGLGILGFKSTTESILYAQPFTIRVTTNFFAFVADCAVLIISIPINRFTERIVNRINNED